MTYHLDRGRNSKKTPLAFLAIVFFLIVFFWPNIQPFVYRVTEPVTKRVFEMLNGVYGVPSFVRVYFSSRRTLEKDDALLRMQVESLESRIVEQDLRIRELSLLFGDSSTSTSFVRRGLPITAASLSQDVTRIYATLILSKGFSDGVEVGNIVYLRGRQIVCRIQDVYSGTSQCELFSGFGNKVEGVTSSSSVTLLLEGRGGHYVANVVRGTNITVGEKILLREDQSFVVGEVAEVFNNDQDTSWHLLIRGAYNPTASSLYYIQKSL